MSIQRLLRLVGSLIVAAAVVVPSVANADASGGILQQVIQRGTIRIAVIGANAPWSSIGPSGEPQGYEIDLANSLAAALGVKPEFVVTDIPGRVAMLQTGKADIAIAEYTNTTDREKAITFTRPYMTIGMQFMVLASRKDLNTIADLNTSSAKIGATRGGFTQTLVPALMPKSSIVNFDNINDEALALDAAQTDATTENWLWNKDLMTKNPGKYKVLPGIYSHEEISIALPKGDFDWWQILDNWVEQYNTSGDNGRMFKKAFGYDLPPQ